MADRRQRIGRRHASSRQRLAASTTGFERSRRARRRARPGAPIVRAFKAGLAQLDELPDVIVKLDADVSMDDDYFERVLGAFVADPRLGIAGGTCLELRDGEWTRPSSPAPRPRRVSLLPPRVPRSSVAARGARRLGRHRRAQSGRARLAHPTAPRRAVPPPSACRRARRRVDGALARQGEGAYFMGYRFSYLPLRSLHHALRDPAALAMIPATSAPPRAASRGAPTTLSGTTSASSSASRVSPRGSSRRTAGARGKASGSPRTGRDACHGHRPARQAVHDARRLHPRSWRRDRPD